MFVVLQVQWYILYSENICQRRVCQSMRTTDHSMRKIVLLILHLHDSLAAMISIIKRHMCLSYRMESSLGGYGALDKSAVPGEHWCMIKCIRHPGCWAFNFFCDGTCELLYVLGDCEELRSQHNSTFVHLSTCVGKTPVNMSPRNWTENACLTWIPHNKDLPCPPGVLTGSGGKFC